MCNSKRVMSDRWNSTWRPPPSWIYYFCPFWSNGLFHILRRLMEGFHKKQLTLVSTFIDFRKAFDSIDRGKIHEVLRHYGIPPKITSAIMILYDKNKSTVMIDGRMSTQFYVTKVSYKEIPQLHSYSSLYWTTYWDRRNLEVTESLHIKTKYYMI